MLENLSDHIIQIDHSKKPRPPWLLLLCKMKYNKVFRKIVQKHQRETDRIMHVKAIFTISFVGGVLLMKRKLE